MGTECALLLSAPFVIGATTSPTTHARTAAVRKIREVSAGLAVVFIGKAAIDGDTA
ncbi:hypothetical protein JJB98_28695 [Bradyrhizobium diazoefficiens]|nr:hypothetical protein [Bradyrhizobium diazoefficiens]QQO23613.1 hypothetical protein JJB98_28695 [Bradyrhizobium diazoefficiens]